MLYIVYMFTWQVGLGSVVINVCGQQTEQDINIACIFHVLLGLTSTYRLQEKLLFTRVAVCHPLFHSQVIARNNIKTMH